MLVNLSLLTMKVAFWWQSGKWVTYRGHPNGGRSDQLPILQKTKKIFYKSFSPRLLMFILPNNTNCICQHMVNRSTVVCVYTCLIGWLEYSRESHTCHVPRPSNSSWFHHSSNSLWALRILKLLSMQSSPLPCYLVPRRSKYLPQQPILQQPQPTFLPQCDRPMFTPIQNRSDNY
jgi:hypothetical protein